MSTPITIPQGLNLCGSVADQTLFLNLMQENYQLLIQDVKTQTGLDITLPGVPGMTFGFPGVSIPGYEAGSWDTRTPAAPLGDGWVGGRMPFRYPGGEIAGKGRYEGVGDWQIPGRTVGVGGLPPLDILFQFIDMNFLLLINSVPAYTSLPFVSVGAFNPCDPVQAAVAIQQMNTMWTQLFSTPTCASLAAYQNFATWIEILHTNVLDPLSVLNLTRTSSMILATMEDNNPFGFPAPVISVWGVDLPVASCRHLSIQCTLALEITDGDATSSADAHVSLTGVGGPILVAQLIQVGVGAQLVIVNQIVTLPGPFNPTIIASFSTGAEQFSPTTKAIAYISDLVLGLTT
jgi:hypothetical protein